MGVGKGSSSPRAISDRNGPEVERLAVTRDQERYVVGVGEEVLELQLVARG